MPNFAAYLRSMNILLIGSGGREHALAWKLTQSPACSALFTAPGNAGTMRCGTNVNIGINDFETIGKFCTENRIGLVVVGPEEPLVKGIVDHFRNEPALQAIPIIGPAAFGAQLEGSKAFAKDFMQRHNIPTAAYQEFTAANYEAGVEYLKNHELPIVLKADGLAAGKGVVICQTREEAVAEFEQMIQHAKFGNASAKVVVEAFLDGIELSVFALTDGKNYVLLPEAKDYKRIGEGDQGLNTGGMGAVSPVPFADAAFMNKVVTRIVEPTINGFHTENMDYIGFVFFGLIKVKGEPFVIEYNCRMGDPETEVVLPRLKNDLVELLLAASKKQLDQVTIEQDPRFVVTTMVVSGGYPGDYKKDLTITGHDAALPPSQILFHAGTAFKAGAVVTAGGRVLAASAYGNTIKEAAAGSKKIVENIDYEGKYFRNDIGYEF